MKIKIVGSRQSEFHTWPNIFIDIIDAYLHYTIWVFCSTVISIKDSRAYARSPVTIHYWQNTSKRTYQYSVPIFTHIFFNESWTFLQYPNSKLQTSNSKHSDVNILKRIISRNFFFCKQNAVTHFSNSRASKKYKKK